MGVVGDIGTLPADWLDFLTSLSTVALPGFCNRGEVRYGSIGGLEYEVPQSRLYCLCIKLDGLAIYLSCDTKKCHDNESTHILHNFWTSTHRGELPPSPLAAPLLVCRI